MYCEVAVSLWHKDKLIYMYCYGIEFTTLWQDDRWSLSSLDLRLTKSIAGTLEPIDDSDRDRMWDIAWAHQSAL